eukprot:CAMPEP_0115834636 /NCGR_PEP_ID=MMETSP0287-20121206/3786_1 /TAXON_ID=412157 /ORGANISM="Chrysochromulina rotalis, Strain UIO044" /LENGTH=71 /DNA_ID=CAMNT_0003288079 /DNA_START=80 /DNA_END=295 /DNA_ORIENTATION=+
MPVVSRKLQPVALAFAARCSAALAATFAISAMAFFPKWAGSTPRASSTTITRYSIDRRGSGGGFVASSAAW